MANPAKIETVRETDAELLRRAQRGDEDSFATLFHANKARIYSLCFRMTMDTGDAEDLTQETFLQAFRKIGNFRGDASVSTWLHRIATNTVLMHFRKKNARKIFTQRWHESGTLPSEREYPSVDQRLTQSITRIALARALKELPKGYRNIFLLHQVKGYDHREIAGKLGCSIGNSKSQLNRAKSRMRQLLTPAAPSGMTA